MKLLALAMQVCEDDRRATRKLPDDLPARAARRRQCFGISNDGELRELPLPF